MKYISTRGGIEPIGFKDAVLMGLSTDGGLILPEKIPHLDSRQLEELQDLSYRDLAFKIISMFCDDIPSGDLKKLIERSYDSFDHPEITPVISKDGVNIVELFHGPTLAFKDVALQLLGNLFEYLLKESGQKMNIVGATSGDTGSAAIYGVRGKENIAIFILHPHGKTSPVQALQMTTVLDANVHNIAVKGTFDDCQNMVKALFNDLSFKEEHALGAVNSINWARVLAQIVYYFYAYFKVSKSLDQRVIFSVPTGNFGDIFAGYIAKRMGLPISQLLLATNENNILTRFVLHGDYSLGTVVPTLSPSMDIQVASNFERYLYFLYQENPLRVREAIEEFSKTGRLHFSPEERSVVTSDFLSQSVDRQETLDTIASFYQETGYLLDPHTAVGVKAAQDHRDRNLPLICLATAHPAKFEEAVIIATGLPPERPASLAGIEKLPSRCEVLDAELQDVKKFIVSLAL